MYRLEEGKMIELTMKEKLGLSQLRIPQLEKETTDVLLTAEIKDPSRRNQAKRPTMQPIINTDKACRTFNHLSETQYVAYGCENKKDTETYGKSFTEAMANKQ